jgi:hypothetical protein
LNQVSIDDLAVHEYWVTSPSGKWQYGVVLSNDVGIEVSKALEGICGGVAANARNQSIVLILRFGDSELSTKRLTLSSSTSKEFVITTTIC